METLQCYCCDHLNPAGARFCNACGTPMHLKPCTRCEAINDRPAMHCHLCGAEFAFPYPAPIAEFPLADPQEGSLQAEAIPDAGGRESEATVGINRVPGAALVAGLIAAVALSAYYAYPYRPPVDRVTVTGGDGGEVVGATKADRTQPVAWSSLEDAPAPPVGWAPPMVEARPIADAGTGDVAQPAEAAPKSIKRDAARLAGASPIRGAQARPAQRTASRSPLLAKSAARPPTRKVPTSSFVASSAPSMHPLPAARPSVVAGVGRAAPRTHPGPIRLGETSRGFSDVVNANSVPSCAEGVGLAPGCDLRTLAKGN